MSTLTTEDIARAFSGHRFEEVVDDLAEDVRWVLVGGDVIEGRDAVLAACRATAAHLREVRTTWERFVCAAGPDAAAVDVVGRYESDEGTSVVSSCDIYEFEGGLVRTITSYTVELDQAG